MIAVLPVAKIQDALLQDFLERLDISELNAVQTESLQKGLLLQTNQLICTPSGSGKTLIAYLALANILLKGEGKAVYLIPYKALAAEKEADCQRIFAPYGVTVEMVTGDSSDPTAPPPDLSHIDLLITTFEKCDSILRNSPGYLAQVRLIVVDEVHELGSPHRGGRLEILLTRFFATVKFTQFILISATIRNYPQILRWINRYVKPFQLVYSEVRPIELTYVIESTADRTYSIQRHLSRLLKDHGQVIIFVNKRRDCLKYAEELAETMKLLLTSEEVSACVDAQRLLTKHRTLEHGLTAAVGIGIGLHHAGIPPTERHWVEEWFRQRTLKVLVATSTLAAGINTPARAVIIESLIQFRERAKWGKDTAEYGTTVDSLDLHDPDVELNYENWLHAKTLSSNQFHQMVGRAGRVGFDTEGEGIILVQTPFERQLLFKKYFQVPDSALLEEGMREAEELGNTQNLQNTTIQATIDGFVDPSVPGVVEEPLPETQILYRGKGLRPAYADLLSQLNEKETLEEMVLVLTQAITPLTREHIVSFVKRTLWAEQHPECNILYELFLTKIPLKHLIERYGNFSLVDPPRPIDHRVHQVQAWEIRGELLFHSGTTANIEHYAYSLHYTNGIRCSCGYAFRIDPKHKDASIRWLALCPHLTYAFYHVLEIHDVYLPVWERLLTVILEHEYVIDFLVEHHFLSETSHGLSLTQLGRLTLALYISPAEAVAVREALESHALSTDQMLLEQLIVIYARTHMPRVNLIEVFTQWIEEQPVDSILLLFPKMAVNDLFSTKNDLVRYAGVFEVIAGYLGDKYTALLPRIKSLMDRIQHGVKAELLDLTTQLPHVSRAQARTLFDAGYPTAMAVMKTDLYALQQTTSLPLRTLGHIRNGTPGKLAKQQSLLEYQV